jgi:RES domain-containing protein
MDGWRISKRRYANPPAAAFDGEGSRRRGGRWTPPGKRVAYASSSLALASLEYFVNLDPQDAPAGLVSVHTSIPDGIRCERVNISSLPESWRGVPFPQELWAVGESWLVAGSSVCLLVPSAVVPEEFNLLINPLHSDFKVLRFSDPSVFNFDPRMWKRS